MLKTEVGTELEPSLRTEVLGLEQRFVSHNRAPLTLGYESTVGPSVTTEWEMLLVVSQALPLAT